MQEITVEREIKNRVLKKDLVERLRSMGFSEEEIEYNFSISDEASKGLAPKEEHLQKSTKGSFWTKANIIYLALLAIVIAVAIVLSMLLQ